MDEFLNIEKGKTVYFFGAGASHASDFKLPCLKDFFKVGFKPDEYPNLYQFIKDNFPSVGLEDLNLEEVITFLELSIDKFGRFGNPIPFYVYAAKDEFGKFVSDKLNYSPVENRSWCKRYGAILKRLNILDSVITLNYDLIIERTLEEFNKDIHKRMYGLLQASTQLWDGDIPTLIREERSMGHFLKLHGSINWVYCPREMCVHHQAFYSDGVQDEVLTSIGYPCKACGTPLLPVIVPPTMGKSFSEFPKLGFLWSLAFRELNQAEKIVIIGVSFTPSDYYLRWLFRSSISPKKEEFKPKIVVGNRERETCHIIQEMTGVTPEFKGDFENYLSSLKEESGDGNPP